jgi:hypothetical protein
MRGKKEEVGNLSYPPRLHFSNLRANKLLPERHHLTVIGATSGDVHSVLPVFLPVNGC